MFIRDSNTQTETDMIRSVWIYWCHLWLRLYEQSCTLYRYLMKNWLDSCTSLLLTHLNG